MKKFYILFFLVFPVVSGCQSMSYDNQRSVPPVGTVVVLNQALDFRVGSSRSYIQHGVAQSQNGVNIREPYCLFYLYESSSAMQHERSIQADRFTVTRSGQGASFASIQPAVQMAAYVPFGDVAQGGPSAQTLTTTLRLHSDTQPQVHELQCSVFGEPFYYGFVSVNQIIQVLGNVVTLEMPVVAQE